MTDTSRRRRITFLAGAGLAALQLAWILAIIPYFGIDEFDHGMRASSVAAGHWEPGTQQLPEIVARGDLIRVREDVARTLRPACELRKYAHYFNCHPLRPTTGGEVLIASGASRYNPLYYVVVGTVAKPFRGNANLFVMRAATAAWGCALFCLAIWIASGVARTLWPLAGILVAALPTTIYSSTVVSPNGVEMFAGLGLWVALLALFRGPPEFDRRLAYGAAAAFTVCVANTHTLGVVWVALTVFAIAVLHGVRVTATRLRPTNRLEVGALVVALAGCLFAVAWTITTGANNPTQERLYIPGSPWSGAIAQGVLLWPLQAIAAFPLRNEAAPTLTYALALAVLFPFVLSALARIGRRSRMFWTVGIVGLVSYVVPIGMTIAAYHQIGAAWQGRYGMPFTAGILVLAGQALEDARHAIRRDVVLVSLGVTAMLIANLLGIRRVLASEGPLHEVARATNWHAPNLAVLLVATLFAGGCWIAALRSALPVAADDAVLPTVSMAR